MFLLVVRRVWRGGRRRWARPSARRPAIVTLRRAGFQICVAGRLRNAGLIRNLALGINRGVHTSMSGFKSRRRFIAGAVCPRCAAVDKVVVDLDSDLRECVACGFSEARPVDSAPRELPTRVSRAAARRVETQAEAVRLIDPAPAESSDRDGKNRQK